MLNRPLIAPLVVAFWCITTGWLLTAKVLPSLAIGSPPGYQAMFATSAAVKPVAWTVQWNERALGWSLTVPRRLVDRGLDVETRLHFDRLPISELFSGWAGTLMQATLPPSRSVAFDARGRLSIDPSGRLRSFFSTIDLPESGGMVTVAGTVVDGAVTIDARAAGMQYTTTRQLPDALLLADELSPQALLPGIYEGRRWTVPVFSPLAAGPSSLEILHAEVGPEEMIYWDQALVRANLVSYRSDPTSTEPPRCRLWVDKTGRVLRQESMVMGALVSFVRRSDEDAVHLLENVADEDAARAEARP